MLSTSQFIRFLPYTHPLSGFLILSPRLMKREKKLGFKAVGAHRAKTHRGFMGERYFHSPSSKAKDERAWRCYR